MANLTDMQAVQKRISRREFIDKKIDNSIKSQISTIISEKNEISNLEMEVVFDNDGQSFPTYGRFINPNNYIKMICDENMSDFNYKIGYFGEEIVLKLTELGLGTCWAGISFSRAKAQIPEGKKLRAVIFFGYVNDELSDFEKYIMSSTSIIQRDVEYFYNSFQDIPQHFINGIKAVVKAPSAMNRQPYHFIYKDNVALAFVEKPDSLQGIDLGIAVKHFEIGCENQIPTKIIDYSRSSL